jgi:hypothetical protein
MYEVQDTGFESGGPETRNSVQATARQLHHTRAHLSRRVATFNIGLHEQLLEGGPI